MKFREYKYLVYSDLYRITGVIRFPTLLWYILRGGTFKYTFWMRTCFYSKNIVWLKYSIYPIAFFLLNHFKYKFGISIPPETKIDSGFYIGHFSGIIVNRHSVIGKNCNISHGVTIGQVNRGKYKGSPILGDNIYIGAGAKIIGSVTIGNFVAIGANCVVTKNIPDHSVVVGIPGRIISQEGSTGYINKIDYDKKLTK